MSKIGASGFLFGDHIDGILIRVLFAHMSKLAFDPVCGKAADSVRRHMPASETMIDMKRFRGGSHGMAAIDFNGVTKRISS